MRMGRWTAGIAVAVGMTAALAPAAHAGPAEDYAAVRADWQADRVVTHCRFTVAQLNNARSVLGPEDAYTDFGVAINNELLRQRRTPCPANRAPVLSRVSFVPFGFRVSGLTTVVVAQRRRRPPPRGSILRYSLSKAATVTIVIDRRVRVRRRIRYLRAGTLTRRSRVASNRVSFSGRIGRRVLVPGLYRATLTGTDPQRRRSALRRASFRIIAG